MLNLSVKTVDSKSNNLSGELSGTRILVVMPSIPVQGMERANIQIMKMMGERGAEILFITDQDYGQKVQKEVESIGCDWSSAKFGRRIHLTKNLPEMCKVIFDLARACWQVDKIYKCFKPSHIHIPDLTSLIRSLPTLWRTKSLVIFSLPNPPDTKITAWKKVINIIIWKYIVKLVCDIIVCNSNYTKSQVDEIGVKNIKTKVIYNCLPERINHKKNDFPIIDKNRFNIVYLGRIKPEKGVNELFQTAKKIIEEYDDVDFYFAGENSWQNPFADRLIQEVNEKNLESRIHFLGEIEDVYGLISKCHINVLPSYYEGFGLTVIEAKSQGVPSVVFPSGALNEIVNHMVDGYICNEKSTDELYKGICCFLNNPSVLKQAGLAAKKSLEIYNKDKIAKEWVSVFKIFNL